MFPIQWFPKNVSKLTRVGPNCDGGYVIPSIVLDKTTVLIGLGVNEDWRFEEEFQKRSKCKVICYDHTVNFRFWVKKLALDLVRLRVFEFFKILKYKLYFDGKKAIHHKKMVGYEQSGSTSLKKIVEGFEDEIIFLKIDIEGWEYRILDDILASKENIIGFAIEFHDVDLHRKLIDKLVNGLSDYVVAHIHGNRYGGVDNNGDPIAIEMTLLRSSYAEEEIKLPNNNSYPIADLDFPNNPRADDIKLRFG